MNERREPDDFAPHCPKCGREMTTALMAAFCDKRKDCEFYADGIEQFYPDDFLPIEGGGTTLYRPLDRSQRVTWPEVDKRTHPANNVRPMVERRGPRASRFNDLETT